MAKAQAQKTKQAAAEEVGTTARQTHEEEVREQLKEIVTQVEESYLDLARLLAETYHKEFYVGWGFQTFEEYCEKELDFQYRKAMYFVEIWDKTKALNIPKNKLEKLGWTKLKDLVAVMTAENAKEWLAKAEKMSTRQVTEAVKITRREDPNFKSRKPMETIMTLKMGESEAAVIMEALEEGKRLCESDNPVLALEMICQDWMQDRGVASERRKLSDHVDYLEKVYGVTIEVTEKAPKKKAAKKEEVEEAAPAKAKDAKKKEAEPAPGKKSGNGKSKAKAQTESIDDLDFEEETAPPTTKTPKGSKRASQDVNDLLGI